MLYIKWYEDEDNSVVQVLSIGVPQGSILRPLLFIIYMNDIQYACNNAYLKLFADDSNIFIKGSNLNEIFLSANMACSDIASWFASNRLTINCDKSAFILFFPNKEDEDMLNRNNLHILLNDHCPPVSRRSDQSVIKLQFIDKR